ncbi:MAG: sigma-70 family RNA polymerase sigma factor [Verrucomicrobia bacterium]|nr:sigma-70 family RNA polymerase sigma factor [Verrucomicrobiota bacterium]
MDDSPLPPGNFPSTRWSLVINAGADSPTLAGAALEALCRRYWYPLYSYVRRTGRSHHEAQDCTQEFLARLLASDGLLRARPERGRFRTFLLTSLGNFLINEWHRAQAAKRGGGAPQVSLDLPPDAAERFAGEPVDPGLTPEQAFDRAWAYSVLDSVVTALGAEYEKSGRGPLFAALRPLVWGDEGEATHAILAMRLGMNTHAFTVALQRLRRRLTDRLREEVAQTVADPAETDAELRHLLGAVR